MKDSSKTKRQLIEELESLREAVREAEQREKGRIAAEERLKKSEQLLKQAQQIAKIASYEWDIARGKFDHSDEMYEIFGLAEDEPSILKNMDHFYELIHPEDIQAVTAAMVESTTGRKSDTVEFRIIRPDGSLRTIHAAGNIVFDDHGDAAKVIGFLMDITDQKRAEAERIKLEAQIQHAQKLESLGVLAGGIAHDFNNLLMGVLGNADLALRKIPKGAAIRDHLLAIIQTSTRAAELCKQMLAYSGKGAFVVSRIDLNEIVTEMTHLLEISVSKRASLKYDLAKKLPAVKADATQIRQVVMNLITNASDALGDAGGVISISTGSMECDRAYLTEMVAEEQLAEGAYVFLEVTDTGCGMDATTQAKIFDPFFSTKFTGRGLGLSAVLGIVRGHGGAIKVYSEVGRGTTFKVLLPGLDQPADRLSSEPAETVEWRGSGIVLLVEDDKRVIQVAKGMLEQIGFKVLTTSNGEEAVELFGERANEITCVLLDLTMPKMDGKETFRELKRIKDDVRVILSSGYNEQEIVNQFAGKGLAGFIQKPYRLDELVAKLKKMFP